MHDTHNTHNPSAITNKGLLRKTICEVCGSKYSTNMNGDICFDCRKLSIKERISIIKRRSGKDNNKYESFMISPVWNCPFLAQITRNGEIYGYCALQDQEICFGLLTCKILSKRERDVFITERDEGRIIIEVK